MWLVGNKLFVSQKSIGPRVVVLRTGWGSQEALKGLKAHELND